MPPDMGDMTADMMGQMPPEAMGGMNADMMGQMPPEAMGWDECTDDGSHASSMLWSGMDC